MTKTMSIRMDKENYEFLTELSKAGKGDLSKAVRELDPFPGSCILPYRK